MFSIQYAKMKKLLFSETVNADFLIDNLETKYCENLLNPKWINDIKVLSLQNTKSERMNVVSIPYVPREEVIGTDVRSRSAANRIREALNSPVPPTQISFAGVDFMSRSFTDELCVILDSFPVLSVTDMAASVRTMFDVVRQSRAKDRIRPTEDSTIKNFDNVKAFFAFMRNQ